MTLGFIGHWLEVWDLGCKLLAEFGLQWVVGVDPTGGYNVWMRRISAGLSFYRGSGDCWGCGRKGGNSEVRTVDPTPSPWSTQIDYLWPGCGQWGWQHWRVSLVCMMGSRQKGTWPLKRRVVVPDGYRMSRVVWSYQLLSDLLEIGL